MAHWWAGLGLWLQGPENPGIDVIPDGGWGLVLFMACCVVGGILNMACFFIIFIGHFMEQKFLILMKFLDFLISVIYFSFSGCIVFSCNDI